MIDRFRALEEERTVKRTAKGKPVPAYPAEFYVLWYRTHSVQRQIIAKRYSEEEAPIAPEVDREIERLVEKFSEEFSEEVV